MARGLLYHDVPWLNIPMQYACLMARTNGANQLRHHDFQGLWLQSTTSLYSRTQSGSFYELSDESDSLWHRKAQSQLHHTRMSTKSAQGGDLPAHFVSQGLFPLEFLQCAVCTCLRVDHLEHATESTSTKKTKTLKLRETYSGPVWSRLAQRSIAAASSGK